MKVLFVIFVLVWTLANIIWEVDLAEREKEHKNERESLLMRKQLFESERASYRTAYEVLAREKEGLKERKLNLAARKESILELEATLLNKQNYLSGLESEINAKMDALEKRSIELEEASKAVLDAACLTEIQDVIEPVDVTKAMKELDKKIEKTKKDGSWDEVDTDKFMDEVRGREPKTKKSKKK